MNLHMVKPEKFGHLYLVYHFTVPLTIKTPEKGGKHVQSYHCKHQSDANDEHRCGVFIFNFEYISFLLTLNR